MVSRISFLIAVSLSVRLLPGLPGAAKAAEPAAVGTAAGAAPRENTSDRQGGELQKCVCPAQQPLEQAFDAASLVFVGRVEDKQINPLKKADFEVKFQVTRKLKGFDEVLSPSVLIYTPKENPAGKIGDCAYDFVKNGEYLVFASGSPAYFKTSTCTRTGLLENSLMDVQRIIRLYSSE